MAEFYSCGMHYTYSSKRTDERPNLDHIRFSLSNRRGIRLAQWLFRAFAWCGAAAELVDAKLLNLPISTACTRNTRKSGNDILIVCCPATPDMRHLIDARVLDALGPEGYLVNIARGGVVGENALVAALKAGRIEGAGLDVFEDEPHPHLELLTMDTVSLSPRIGSGTHEARAAMGRSMIDSLLQHFEAKPGAYAPETLLTLGGDRVR